MQSAIIHLATPTHIARMLQNAFPTHTCDHKLHKYLSARTLATHPLNFSITYPPLFVNVVKECPQYVVLPMGPYLVGRKMSAIAQH